MMTISNSTFSGNWSAGSDEALGGGLSNVGTLQLLNSTLSGNWANDGGGGLQNIGTLHLSNTIIANSPAGGDCLNTGSIGTNLASLIEDGSCTAALSGDPLLGPLQDNGGPTWTHALLEFSPALDTGDTAVCALPPVNGLDQRGVTRPQGPGCDIGAFEREVDIEPITGLAAFNNSPTLLGAATTLTATVTGGTEISYTWNFGDGTMGAGAIVTHTYTAVGPYTAIVTATNPISTMTTTTAVTIHQVPAPEWRLYLPVMMRPLPT
jgi:hypothetical protein